MTKEDKILKDRDKILKRQGELLKEMNRTLLEPYLSKAQEDPTLKIIDSLPGMGREQDSSKSVKNGEELIKRVVDQVHLEMSPWPEFHPSPELFSQLGLPEALLDPPPREPGNIYYLETIPRKGDIHPRVMRRDLLSLPYRFPTSTPYWRRSSSSESR